MNSNAAFDSTNTTPLKQFSLSNAGVLSIAGSNANDKFMFKKTADNMLRVISVVNGETAKEEHRFSRVKTIRVNSRGGDDLVNNLTSIKSILNGGAGNDRLFGGTGKDTIRGRNGNDVLRGRGGNDVIKGDKGNDSVFGGDGRDRLFGGTGNDRLLGDSGNDSLKGLNGNDHLKGGSGNDVAIGGNGNDRLFGDRGNDRLLGGTGNDLVTGNSGDDKLVGNAGVDKLSGGGGNDLINGGSGNDKINGQSGDDTVIGSSGNDKLTGGAGSDKIRGGTGDDTLSGNGGNDNIDGQQGADSATGGSGDDVSFGNFAEGDTLNGGGHAGDRDIMKFFIDNTSDASDGNFSTGQLSIREALENFDEDDAISFSKLSGDVTIKLDSGNHLVIDDDISINGGNRITFDGVAASGSNRVFVVNNDKSFTLQNSIVTGGDVSGEVDEASYGGAIYSYGNLTAKNVTFTNNKAVFGGALEIRGDATIIDSTFTENSATDDGGAIEIDDFGEGRIARINGNNVFDNNAATGDGGAIGLFRGDLRLSDATITGNTAASDGGGIYVGTAGRLTISNSTITDNTAGGDGGGIVSSGETLNLSDSTVSDNTATTGNGGGLSLLDGVSNLTNVTVDGNTANEGGGLFIDSLATATITSSAISDNDATSTSAGDGGGGVYLKGGDLTIRDTTIELNRATFGGGILSNETGGSLLITGSSIIGNRAGLVGSSNGSGGGIYQTKSSMTMINSTIAGNANGSHDAAAFGGAGIRNDSFATATLIHVTVAFNVNEFAQSKGAGIRNSGTLYMDNSIVVHNFDGVTFFDIQGSVDTTTGFGRGNLVGDPNVTHRGGLSDAAGFDNIFSDDPNLQSFGDNGGPTHTFAILAGSSAHNTGRNDRSNDENGNPLVVDQRGSLRPVGQVDIGAFEVS